MNSTILRASAAAVTLTAALALTGCGADNSTSGMPTMSGMPSMNSTSPTASSTSAAGSSTASSSSTPAAGAHNDADVSFAEMMIPHHRQAIEMADLLLAKNGIDPKVSDLASQIKGAQTPEITQMSGWLTGWGANPSPSSMSGMDGMDMGDGLMSQADMDNLKNATGTKAASLFLSGMIIHHQGAITMAKTELTDGQNPEAKKLSQSITTSQQAEIQTMKKLLTTR